MFCPGFHIKDFVVCDSLLEMTSFDELIGRNQRSSTDQYNIDREKYASSDDIVHAKQILQNSKSSFSNENIMSMFENICELVNRQNHKIIAQPFKIYHPRSQYVQGVQSNYLQIKLDDQVYIEICEDILNDGKMYRLFFGEKSPNIIKQFNETHIDDQYLEFLKLICVHQINTSIKEDSMSARPTPYVFNRAARSTTPRRRASDFLVTTPSQLDALLRELGAHIAGLRL